MNRTDEWVTELDVFAYVNFQNKSIMGSLDLRLGLKVQVTGGASRLQNEEEAKCSSINITKLETPKKSF